MCTLSINHYENVLNKIHILFIILFFFSVPPNYIGVVVNQQVYADAPFSLALNLEASPPVHNFTWTRNGMVLNGNIINGNLTANSISISLIRPSDAGIYSVVAINILGSDTASFNLSVLCKLFELFWCLCIYNYNILGFNCNLEVMTQCFFLWGRTLPLTATSLKIVLFVLKSL